jgi:hypothetical protein
LEVLAHNAMILEALPAGFRQSRKKVFEKS